MLRYCLGEVPNLNKSIMIDMPRWHKGTQPMTHNSETIFEFHFKNQ